MRISDWSSDVCSSDLAINSAYNATRFIDRQDRRRFGSIFRHAGTNRFLIIVGAPLELRTAAFIANTLLSRLFEGIVIAFTACGAGKAAGNAFHQGVFINIKFDDMVKRAPTRGQNLIE